MLATAVAFFVVAATCVFAQTKLLRFPDIHGDRVAFTYGGDIWTAPANGGTAIRLTAQDRKSTRLNSSHLVISYAVFCLKKKKQPRPTSSNTPDCLLDR